MTVTTSAVVSAEDQKQGMTLDELAAFVQNALRHDIPGGTRMHVRVNVRGGIKRIETRACAGSRSTTTAMAATATAGIAVPSLAWIRKRRPTPRRGRPPDCQFSGRA
jgi:hypothetical protein